MQYKNPIIFCDYSDPDVIRVGKYFYMVASSFNYVPGVPVLRSENLVEWELVNYVITRLPFDRFNGKVCAGDGAWAPAIRYHNGRYYCLIPFPDDGIYVSESEAPESDWTPLRPLIEGKGIIDPCPIWDGDRCYVAVAFARTRAGFNSKIGLYEVTPDLTECLSKTYTIVYDGHNNNPIIEGPKFYKRGNYFYILAPAGSVKSGWQVALRSEKVTGPYKSKVILMQGDSLVNGPHQGALIDTPDGNDWFIHFQDMRAYGRVVHLEPVEWFAGWPLCGKVKYDGIAGTPVEGGEYPVDCTCADGANKTPYARRFWQLPSNPRKGWFANGNILTCAPFAETVNNLPNAATVKLAHKDFTFKTSVETNFVTAGDEFGFGLLGNKYAYLSVCDGKVWLVSGEGENETVKPVCPADRTLNLEVRGRFVAPFTLLCNFAVNGQYIAVTCEITAGVWVGARLAMFSRNKKAANSAGYAKVLSFKVE